MLNGLLANEVQPETFRESGIVKSFMWDPFSDVAYHGRKLSVSNGDSTPFLSTDSSDGTNGWAATSIYTNVFYTNAVMSLYLLEGSLPNYELNEMLATKICECIAFQTLNDNHSRKCRIRRQRPVPTSSILGDVP